MKMEGFTTLFLLISTILALFIYNTDLKYIYDYILNDVYIVNEFSMIDDQKYILNNVDFPTFGRPIILTKPDLNSI